MIAAATGEATEVDHSSRRGRMLSFFVVGALMATGLVAITSTVLEQPRLSLGEVVCLLVLSVGALILAYVQAVQRAWRLDLRTYAFEWFSVVTMTFAVGTFLTVLLSGVELAPAHLGLGYAVCLGWAYIGQRMVMKYELPEVALVPGGRISEVAGLPSVVCRLMTAPGPVHGRVVVVDLQHRLPGEWVNFLAECQLRGVPVLHAGAVYERLTGRSSVRYLRDAVFDSIQAPRIAAMLKRVGEVAVITALLPLVVPLMATTAIAIRLSSPGPVLFWQERVGLAGRPFRLVKFRSMRLGAEGEGAKFATAQDSRVTSIGRFLRKFRIDELPQLYNVIRGEMSLIGPRPEQVPFVKHFTGVVPFYAFRHTVRPGLTGWAQVRFGYAGSDAEVLTKLEYDLFYVKNLSIWLDAYIVALTIRTIFTGFGSR